jgi:hypothetical protein
MRSMGHVRTMAAIAAACALAACSKGEGPDAPTGRVRLNATASENASSAEYAIRYSYDGGNTWTVYPGSTTGGAGGYLFGEIACRVGTSVLVEIALLSIVLDGQTLTASSGEVIGWPREQVNAVPCGIVGSDGVVIEQTESFHFNVVLKSNFAFTGFAADVSLGSVAFKSHVVNGSAALSCESAEAIKLPALVNGIIGGDRANTRWGLAMAINDVNVTKNMTNYISGYVDSYPYGVDTVTFGMVDDKAAAVNQMIVDRVLTLFPGNDAVLKDVVAAQVYARATVAECTDTTYSIPRWVKDGNGTMSCESTCITLEDKQGATLALDATPIKLAKLDAIGKIESTVFGIKYEKEEQGSTITVMPSDTIEFSGSLTYQMGSWILSSDQPATFADFAPMGVNDQMTLTLTYVQDGQQQMFSVPAALYDFAIREYGIINDKEWVVTIGNSSALDPEIQYAASGTLAADAEKLGQVNLINSSGSLVTASAHSGEDAVLKDRFNMNKYYGFEYYGRFDDQLGYRFFDLNPTYFKVLERKSLWAVAEIRGGDFKRYVALQANVNGVNGHSALQFETIGITWLNALALKPLDLFARAQAMAYGRDATPLQ